GVRQLGVLQTEKGIDHPVVSPQSCGPAGVHVAVTAFSTSNLEAAGDVELAERIAAGAAVVEEVSQDSVLADIRLQTGRVNDELGRDLEHAVIGLDPGDDGTLGGHDLSHLPDVGLVPPFLAAPLQL